VKTGQEHGIRLYLKQSLLTTTQSTAQQVCHPFLLSIGRYLIISWTWPHHLLDLAKLPIGEKFSSIASAIVEQTIDVQKEVRTRLEKSNVKYKATADKRRREKVFEEGDMVMVYLRKEKIPAGTYNKVEATEIWFVQNREEDQ